MSPTKRTPKPKPPPDPTKLAREAAGSYRSGDGRFLVRQDRGGKWYVTDSEQTNELGLELVQGPFATIAEAKEAVASQREHPAGASPGAKVRTLVASDRQRPKSTGSPKSAARARPKLQPEPKAKPEPEPKAKPEPEPKAKPRAERQPQPEPKAKPEPPPDPEPKPEPEPDPLPPKVDYRPAPRPTTGDERDAVAAALRRINDAWTAGRPEDMRDFLDPHVVFVQPGFARHTEGRDAAIGSYSEFAASAVIHAYAESDLTIDLHGHTAVATYAFEMHYEIAGKPHVDTGRDLFVFDRTGTRWRAVWRLPLPDPDRGRAT